MIYFMKVTFYSIWLITKPVSNPDHKKMFYWTTENDSGTPAIDFPESGRKYGDDIYEKDEDDSGAHLFQFKLFSFD